MYPKKLSCSTEKLNFTLPHFLYIWGDLALISLTESPDVLDCFGKGSTLLELLLCLQLDIEGRIGPTGIFMQLPCYSCLAVL